MKDFLQPVSLNCKSLLAVLYTKAQLRGQLTPPAMLAEVRIQHNVKVAEMRGYALVQLAISEYQQLLVQS